VLVPKAASAGDPGAMEYLQDGSIRISVQDMVEGAAEWLQTRALSIPVFQDSPIITEPGAEVNAFGVFIFRWHFT
jgi:hypothetical protein